MVAKCLIYARHLGGQLSGETGPDIGLEHQRHPWCDLGEHVDGAFDHGHYLIPLTLDIGEHRVGLIRQARFPHHPNRGRDGRTHAPVVISAERAHTERDDHDYCLLNA